MQRFTLLFILLLTTHVDSFSREIVYTPDRKVEFAIRGKALPFFLLEDVYALTATIGGEVTFYNRHSIGIDATWFKWIYEEDDFEDNALYRQYERRTYLLADYKFRVVTFGDVELYLNAYDKIGNYNSWYKLIDGEHFSYTGFLNSTVDGTFNEYGLGAGAKVCLYDSNFGIDCSANFKSVYNQKDFFQYGYPDSYAELKNVKSQKYGFYMRLNLFYRFG